MPLSEHVHCVAVAFKMTEQLEQQSCGKFCIKLEHSPAETIQMTQKATAMSNWWLAASSQQCTRSCITYGAEFFGKTSSHLGDSGPLQPRFGVLQLLAFPKTKITYEKEKISDPEWESGKCDRAADGDWERSHHAYFEGDWCVIVLCTVFLISSSIDVSIFHITWLDTFRKELIYR